MTDPVTADHIYLKPLTKKSIREILEKHDIDAVLPTMGGQTALNLAVDCHKAGIWEKHGVRIIGANLDAIETTEGPRKVPPTDAENRRRRLQRTNRHFVS